ncbi:MAG: S8 family serine peptidase [Alphaproteobacteria bacterium]|jgi:serine protease|nr:S8 family serine peptidase [Alphaproteobacteria bacterium]
MPISQRFRPSRILSGLAGGLAVLAGCDMVEDRAERAREVTEAAMDQVAGETAGSDTRTSISDVPVDARAFSGQFIEQPEINTQTAARPSRFAIGSIIAKPRELPPPPGPQEALMMQSPEAARDLGIEALPAPETLELPEAAGDDDKAREYDGTEAEGDYETLERPRIVEPGELDQKMPRALPRDQMKLARRAVMTPRAIQVQTDARSTMLETMTEFGLSGQVEMNRSGQVVIQIGEDGADPTQQTQERALELENFEELPLDRDDLVLKGSRSRLFTPLGAARADLPRQALNANIECPETIDREELKKNEVLATECMIAKLKKTGQFEYVEKDFIFEHQFARRENTPPVKIAVTPDDPLWDLQWHFRNNGEGEGQSPGGAGFKAFWEENGKGSRDVVVAVVDTGLDMDHPDITASVNVAPGWDMVSDPSMGNDGDGRDPDPDDPGDLCDPNDPQDEDTYHGTHVAGTIGAGATDNGAGVAGGAWDVTIVPVRALGKCGGRLTDINDSIRWAAGLVPAFDAEGNEVWNENPADIVNLSIGLFEFCPASLQEAINAVTERGVVVVSAAGNARVSTRYYSPGGCENVVSVAAGDARGQIAPYSNFGDEVDVLAPGGDLSRDDNGDGRPDGILSTRLAESCFDPVTNEPVETCYYAFEQGTSMAAPHVSAALALIKAQQPELMGSELRDRLLAALKPRSAEQCAGPCEQYPGAEPIAGSDGLCARPCGGGLLDLGGIDLADGG